MSSKSDTQNKTKYDRIIIRDYPKSIFFYPLGFISILLGIILAIIGEGNLQVSALFAALWLGMFAFNFLVVTFNFSLGRTAGILMTVAFLYVLLLVIFDEQLPQIVFPQATASPAFYIYNGLIILGTLIAVLFVSIFHYWEVRPTELYLRGGLFEDSHRYGNAQHAHIYKETPDIFERILLRSGSIIIIPERSKRAFKLDNVYNATKKEKLIREILSYVPDKHSSQKEEKTQEDTSS